MFSLLEAIIIVVVILILFGGSRLPGLSKGIGRMMTHIKYGLRGDDGIKVRKRGGSSHQEENHTE